MLVLECMQSGGGGRPGTQKEELGPTRWWGLGWPGSEDTSQALEVQSSVQMGCGGGCSMSQLL